MSRCIEDPELTYAEANYLLASVILVQRAHPRYMNDAVLDTARRKMLLTLARHANKFPEDLDAVESDLDFQRRLKREEDE